LAQKAENKIWQTVLGEMEVIFPKTIFKTWFRDTVLEIEGDGATVLTSNAYARDWLKKKGKQKIIESLKKAAPELTFKGFELNKTQPLEQITLEIRAEKRGEAPLPGNFKKDYVFESFVVGNNNAFAYAVAQEVAGSPGSAHNPLFIYGGVGLGKTHLAQAIGHEIKQKKPTSKIVYVSCETFTNDFINSIASKKMNEFKKNYREVDVLIVDDIQFLSTKVGSQEEFFHTFNALHQRARQIILTADKVPQAIPALEGRLASRFGGGMVVDIQPPNFETRVAILNNKCKEKNCVVSEDVLGFIAKNITSNIRELEGALNRLVTHCQFNGVSANLATAQEILKDFVSSSNRAVGTAEIIEAVCRFFSIEKDDLLGHKRKQELVLPRQIAVFLIREQTNKSYPEIGAILGGKDHTTILYSEKKILNLVKSDSSIKDSIDEIRSILQSANI